MATLAPRTLLDRALEAIDGRSQIAEGVTALMEGLGALRQRTPRARWAEFCGAECAEHPLRQILHQDPLTERAYTKPRGIPGDAIVIDLLIRGGVAPAYVERATRVGQKIYDRTSDGAAARALRRRREILATMIDRVGERVPQAHVLNLGCGHLREAEMSKALSGGSLGRFVAVDEDGQTLEVVGKRYSGLVDTMACTVNEFIDLSDSIGRFDLIYAAGPYDGLNRWVATRLTEALFRITKPGGLLLVTNFVQGSQDAGYMEAFMDWHMTYRTPTDMFALTADIPDSEVSDRRTFAEDAGSVAYLAVRRRP
jgi:extracellular factor (EF) 3-hydroxypalmitic acid methyl ester biosynthesis protein